MIKEKWISTYTSIEFDVKNHPNVPTVLKIELPNDHLIWIDKNKEYEFFEKLINLLKEYSV